MPAAPLKLTRAQILAFRRHVGALDERLPRGKSSLRRAAWAGLQDSMPRAALLSIHSRVAGTEPTTWEDPSLVQLWGPRFNAYVVAARDLAVFSLGRFPGKARTRSTRSARRVLRWERRSATRGSSPATNRRFARHPGRPHPLGSSPAAMPSTCSKEPTASSSSPTRRVVAGSGPHASGRAHSSSRARSPGRGDARTRRSMSSPGVACRARTETPSSRRRSPCPYPGRRGGSSCAGRPDATCRLPVDMAEVLLFHHAQGLTPGVIAFADELRAAGHTVETPDLYDGNTMTELAAGIAYAQQVGFDTIGERGSVVAESMPKEIVYAGISLGVMAAQELAQTRDGARGAAFISGCFPPSEFATEWPRGVPAQVHMMEQDEWVLEGDLDAARQLADSTADADLFLYPGDRHLFIDNSTPDYDESAATLLKQRVLAFLDGL